VSAPASWPRATLAQVVVEGRLTARRGENVLALIGIPVGVLLFFGSVGFGQAQPGATRIETLLPGVLALAVLAAGLVNLGIATAYERSYGVLKRLGGSPLGRSGLIAAKLLAVLAIELLVAAVLVGVATVVFEWRAGPGASIAAFLLVLVVGTVTFAGLGLALAGTLRAETVLVLANVLFLLSLVVGRIIVPATPLADPAGDLGRLLPGSALADAFRAALGAGEDLWRSLAVVGAWGLGALVVAGRWFRWE
jgi:ABC-2 type transport system permease protein